MRPFCGRVSKTLNVLSKGGLAGEERPIGGKRVRFLNHPQLDDVATTRPHHLCIEAHMASKITGLTRSCNTPGAGGSTWLPGSRQKAAASCQRPLQGQSSLLDRR